MLKEEKNEGHNIFARKPTTRWQYALMFVYTNPKRKKD